MSTATISDKRSPRIAAICPSCHTRWMVLPQLIGKKACCGKCKAQFVVPSTSQMISRAPKAPANPVEGLFSREQIGVATLFGSVLAGAILIAMNLARLGRRAAAVETVIAGLITLVAAGVISYFGALRGLPAHYVLPLALAFGAKGAAGEMFALQYAINEQHGIKSRSHWTVVGVTVAGMVAIAAILFVLVGTFMAS